MAMATPLDRFPRVSLGRFPTPLDHLPRYGTLIGHDRLYIKRDDLTDLALGGNKVRNLEFLLGDALAQGADVILAAGGLQSNYCRLAAAAAAKLGLECILVHNADRPAFFQGNILLDRLLGAKSLYLGPVTEAERGQRMSALADELRRQGRRPYVIGYSPVSTLGYALAAFELHDQAGKLGIDLKHVVIVGAMAGTATGFLYGTALLGRPFQVHIISVEYPADELRETIEAQWAGVSDLVGVRPAFGPLDVGRLYTDYLGDGYGVPTAGALRTIHDLARTEAILIENVYNSKTLHGLSELVRNGMIPRDEAVCFVHTGGTPALFAQAEQLQGLGE